MNLALNFIEFEWADMTADMTIFQRCENELSEYDWKFVYESKYKCFFVFIELWLYIHIFYLYATQINPCRGLLKNCYKLSRKTKNAYKMMQLSRKYARICIYFFMKIYSKSKVLFQETEMMKIISSNFSWELSYP